MKMALFTECITIKVLLKQDFSALTLSCKEVKQVKKTVYFTIITALTSCSKLALPITRPQSNDILQTV